LLSVTNTVAVQVSVANSVPTVHERVEVVEADEQYAEPAVIAQEKVYTPDPRVALVPTERVWPWSAEHPEEHGIGDD
jgi:hypothetical protein